MHLCSFGCQYCYKKCHVSYFRPLAPISVLPTKTPYHNTTATMLRSYKKNPPHPPKKTNNNNKQTTDVIMLQKLKIAQYEPH